MSIIAPTYTDYPEKNIKRLISDSIKKMGNEEITVSSDDIGVPVIMKKREALAKRLWDIALYSDNEKVVGTVAKIILEFSEGKPEVRANEQKQAVAPVQIIVHQNEKEELERKAQYAIEEKESRISLGDGMEVIL